MGKITEVLNKPSDDEILSYLNGFKRELSGGGDWETAEKQDSKLYSIAVRHWGSWDVSDDQRNDPDNDEEDFEDWDWEELDTKDAVKAGKSFEEYIKKCSFVKYIKSHEIETGEKNWIYFNIEMK